MNGFLDIQFPSEIAYGSQSSIGYSTLVQKSISGKEQRNINWLYPKYSFNLAPAINSKADLDKIIAFFHIVQGKAYSFRFRDFSDFFVLGGKIANGDGVKIKFQLKKIYSVGTNTRERIISKIEVGSVNIYLDDILQNPSQYTLNYLSGEITFNTAPAINKVIKADFNFDVQARFNTDNLSHILNSHNYRVVEKIELVEV
jgi:uncharacterized protein (TIGR02217 family)